MPYCERSSPPALVLTFSCPIPTQQLLAAQVLPPDSFVSIAAIEQDLSAEFRVGDACKAFSICCGLGVWQAQATPQATSTMKRMAEPKLSARVSLSRSFWKMNVVLAIACRLTVNGRKNVKRASSFVVSRERIVSVKARQASVAGDVFIAFDDRETCRAG